VSSLSYLAVFLCDPTWSNQLVPMTIGEIWDVKYLLRLLEILVRLLYLRNEAFKSQLLDIISVIILIDP
jgi:hypothetical protein